MMLSWKALTSGQKVAVTGVVIVLSGLVLYFVWRLLKAAYEFPKSVM